MSDPGPSATNDARALHGRAYAERFDRMHGRRRLAQLMPLMRLGPGDDLVDFACGNGLLALEVHERVRNYTGVDFSQPFIDLAIARTARIGAANLRFECASIEHFCAAHARRFDVACAFDFSEHVPDRDWLALLAAIRSALKAGGRLYLHTPNANFVLERMKRRNFILRQSPEHVAVRDMGENLRLLRESGFSIALARFVRHYNVFRFVDPLRHLPGLGHWFEARIFIEARAP
jgi:2-polyprenyl-6-hydroxyphenyl methylase / 3-demethylubiquinone-9 3-methyltransferase